jgi:hypothetical protein
MGCKQRPRVAGRLLAFAIAASILTLLAPAAAQAHGPVDPSGSTYLARIAHVPAGLQARAIDGDLRLWMRVSPSLNVYVIDYRGAPYLHFGRDGVWVNQNSSMYFLNQIPPVTPSTDLGSDTRPDWHRVSTGHTYVWHDGRLHAGATQARLPGTRFAGDWSVPLRIDGTAAAIRGGLYYAPPPSPVWFWPVAVMLGCVLAGVRLRRPALDRRLARISGAIALAGFVVASIGHQLHGRPGVSAGNVLALVVELAAAAAAAWYLHARDPRWLVLAAIAALTLWQGVSQIAALEDGWVLLALPAVVGRVAVAACLAGGAGLIPLVLTGAERAARARSSAVPQGLAADDESQDDEAWEPGA